MNRLPDLAGTFDTQSSAYTKYRPGYPDSVRDVIESVASLRKGARILEIGCGTGQATDFFSHLEPNQTCIDPGQNMIDECAVRFPSYSFACCRFEDYAGLPASFDLLYAATSFHWIERGTRYRKSAELTKPGGHLAVLTDRHVRDMAGFFTEVGAIYEELAPDMAYTFAETETTVGENNPLSQVEAFETDRVLEYTADEYVGLLHTFSGHIALGEPRLNKLCERIHALIETRYSGSIKKTLTTFTSIYRQK